MKNKTSKQNLKSAGKEVPALGILDKSFLKRLEKKVPKVDIKKLIEPVLDNLYINEVYIQELNKLGNNTVAIDAHSRFNMASLKLLYSQFGITPKVEVLEKAIRDLKYAKTNKP